MDKIDFDNVFESLNDELRAIGEMLVLICAGGYVMQLHGYKATADVDAFFSSNTQIDTAIKKVGDKHGINPPNELWLNNSIANLNPLPPNEHQQTIKKYSNLTIKAVDKLYLIGMKLQSGRSRDIRDVATMLSTDMPHDPIELYTKLTEIGFASDISAVLEAFSQARGLDWLGAYYETHEETLLKFF
jgi:hypothetical protein